MPKVSPPAEHGRLLNQRAMLEMKRSKPLPPEEGAMATDVNYKPVDLCQAYRLLPGPRPLGGVNLELEPEDVDYNFHYPADTNASIVGSHFWVYVLQLPRAGQATHTPAYFCWRRTLAVVGKHGLQLCAPRYSHTYQAQGGWPRGPAEG